MSKFNTTNIENTSGGAPNFSQGLNVEGTDILTLVTPTEYYTGASEPSSPANGAVWYDGTNVKQYINSGWYTLSVTAPLLYLGATAVINLGRTKNLDYYTIQTAANSADFGDLTVSRDGTGSASNRTIGVFYTGDVLGTSQNTIDYITFSTPGNATDFGDGIEASQNSAGMSDGTYGVFGPLDGFFTYNIVYIT